MSEELEPCPFCDANKAIWIDHQEDTLAYNGIARICCDNCEVCMKQDYVFIDGCGYKPRIKAKKNLIKRWNTRTTER